MDSVIFVSMGHKIFLVEFVVEVVDGRGKLVWRKTARTASTAATAEEFQKRDSVHLAALKRKRFGASANQKEHKIVEFKRLKELTQIGLLK